MPVKDLIADLLMSLANRDLPASLKQVPATVTGLFEVVDIINAGSYGKIFRVIKKSNFHLGNRMAYAMKALKRTTSSFKDIEIEMQILSLVNPYKLHLESFFVDGDKYFMILDYCQNGTLLKAITDKIGDNGYFEEDEIWKYFIQICFGLECLHYNDFIHGDIHAQNILLDYRNNIKIADFGISRYLGTKTVEGASAYYSPRTRKGIAQSKESDIWAVGCLCRWYNYCKWNYDAIVRGCQLITFWCERNHMELNKGIDKTAIMILKRTNEISIDKNIDLKQASITKSYKYLGNIIKLRKNNTYFINSYSIEQCKLRLPIFKSS